jgi:hypothetical protein
LSFCASGPARTACECTFFVVTCYKMLITHMCFCAVLGAVTCLVFRRD